MNIKGLLACSLVMAQFGFMTVGAFAYDSGNGGNLSLTPNPNTGYAATYPPPTNTGYPNPYANTANTYVTHEDPALKAHVSSIPKGTMLMVKFDRPISSYSSKVGDSLTAVVEADVFTDGVVVVPSGSQVEGYVSGVTPAGHVGKNGALEIQFNLIKTSTGNVIPVRAHIVTNDNTGILKGDTDQARVLKTVGSAAAITGTSTLMGTALGGLLSSVGPGALFGLAAGGVAGISYAVIRQGKQVEIPGGARMSLVLDEQVAFN